MVDIAQIISLLKKAHPDAKVALNFRNTYELLVSVILSAQCTDVQVNKITPALFERFPTVADMAECDVRELEKMIYSTGFYKNKAKNIRAACSELMKNFDGKVPDSMAALLRLPGVARKTANVILDAGFGRHEGIVVDTHVCRVSGKLGLVPAKLSESKNAVKIEEILMKVVPRRDWGKFAHLLVFHGRRICIARRPKCKICPLNKVCPSADLNY